MPLKLRIKEAMVEDGIETNRELATRTQVSEATLGPYVRDAVLRIDLDVFDRICKGLNRQPGDLLVRVED